GFVQVLIIVVPLLIAYALFHNHINLPGGVTLSHIPLAAKAIAIGVIFLGIGLTLFTGILVGFGSLYPSAQDASRYLALAIIWVYMPIYAVGYIISSPHALIVSVFTYFPLTAPSTVLLRNAVGTISNGEILTSMAITLVTAVLALLFAVRAFSYGAMAYSRRVNIKELF
ncbi:MAG: ABC transporter permease, partial [Candidatus Saccharimonadales bacterium]